MNVLSYAATFAACAGLLIAQNSLSPFEGKWKLDKNKTQAVGVPEDLEFEIKGDGPNGMVIKSKYREPKNAIYPLMWLGIMTFELPLSTDGSEKINQIGPFAHVSKTRVEGNRLVTDWTANTDTGHAQGQWIRTLSAGGKEMTVQVVTKASDGRNMDQTLVMRRR